MKIVLDTNVLVSGLLNPYGAPGEIVRLIASGDLELCYDARIFTEYERVLKRPKFNFDEDAIDTILDQIIACGHIVIGKPLSLNLDDPADEPFLEICIAGEVEYFITGNIKHFTPETSRGCSILTPTEFIEKYRNK